MYVVVGYEKVNYTNKEGKQVNGTRLHLAFKSDKIEGDGVECVYISSSVDLPVIKIGSKIELLYNKFGRVSDVRLAE